MEKEKTNEIFYQYKNLVPDNCALKLKKAIEKADDNKEEDLMMVKTYNPVTVLLLSIFLGAFGIDRFYIKDTGIGIGKLLFFPVISLLQIIYSVSLRQILVDIASNPYYDPTTKLTLIQIIPIIMIVAGVIWAIWSLIDIYFSYKRCKEKNLDNVLLALGFKTRNYN